MTPLTAEWVQKAEMDWWTALREVAVVELPNYDAAGFHAQQCAEKYLKARLVEAGARVPRTHDLRVLLLQLKAIEPTFAEFEQAMADLTAFAVEFRYPGYQTSFQEAEQAVAAASRVRQAVRAALDLDA